MTESEWLTCTDPQKMLEFLEGRASERKLRLFACACCRRVREFLWTSFSYRAVLVAERYADHLASAEELDEARWAVETDLELYPAEPVYDASYWACSREITWEAVKNCAGYAGNCCTRQIEHKGSDDFGARCDAIQLQEHFHQARLLHDIIGNPFRPVALSPAWLSWNDCLIPRLAQGIYDERWFQDLPILADALEEAGCTDADLLGHLRSQGPHVRGCWPADLLLGRS